MKNIILGVVVAMSLHSTPVEVFPEGRCLIEGVQYPAVGFGTYRLKGEVCSQAVQEAYECGYRIIDTATFYENFHPIADVLKKDGRNNFYLISKVWPNSHTRPLLQKDLKATLEQLQTNFIDAYFLHWPNSSVPIEETLSTLEEFRVSGQIRHIGMSNVTINHLKRAFELKIPITWVQVEMSPFYYDPDLLEFCKNNLIVVQAWGPLGRGKVDDPLLQEIGKKYNKTASQVAVKWIIQHGAIPLPGSKNPKHIEENIDFMDFMLSEEDMDLINEKARHGKRQRIDLDHGLGFADEFDYTYEECWPKPIVKMELN